jgi:four helix bundle protein
MVLTIDRFEDIKAWQAARELTGIIYALTGKETFSRDYGLKDQIQRASGSVMHNIAEGFDAESNVEFTRFLRYAKRSCTEVQSQLYLAFDQNYINQKEFDEAYNLTSITRATIHGFIRYLVNYKTKNQRP